MTGERALQGLTVAVAQDFDVAATAALRAQGAAVHDHLAADALLTGLAAVAVGRLDQWATSPSTVGIRPTDGALSVSGAMVFADDLDHANATMAVLTAVRRQRWPADVRLAAQPEPVVAVPAAGTEFDDVSRAALDAAIAALGGAGARITSAADDVDSARDDPDDAADTADTAIVPRWPCDTDLGCSVTVPSGSGCVTVQARAFDDAVALDVAALVAGIPGPQNAWPLVTAEHTELIVFGAHLRGGALAHQLTDLGARWAGAIATSDRYRMTRLPTTPPKPAVTRVPDGVAGAAIVAQRWLLSPAALGRFLVALPAPMQLGKVEFDDGSWRTSFGCDGVAADAGVDISGYGGWAAAVAAGAVD